LVGLFGGYALLLAAAVVFHGLLVNELAESLVWESLLTRELDYFLERRAADGDYAWADTDSIQLYASPGRAPPPEFSALPLGLHDEVVRGGREFVVLVRELQDARYAMALDITDLEAQEASLTLFMSGTAFALVAVLGVLLAFGLRRVLRPLVALASDITALAPDRTGQTVRPAEGASVEVHIVARGLNDFLRRQEAFVEREREFNEIASHELRTPIAVIAGAGELTLEQPGLPPVARRQVERILQTARGMEGLLAVLLTLAKDPERLDHGCEPVALHELLPEIIEDHGHLLGDKDLEVNVEALEPCFVQAPLHLVQSAVGNLLRNAIENSDRGRIRISLASDGTVTIEDTGHGMSPAEISTIYAQIARGGGREAGGIGLDLLGRLCEHLGWTLAIQSVPGQGTMSRLRLNGLYG
jgi:signal transduction histidine kinase